MLPAFNSIAALFNMPPAPPTTIPLASGSSQPLASPASPIAPPPHPLASGGSCPGRIEDTARHALSRQSPSTPSQRRSPMPRDRIHRFNGLEGSPTHGRIIILTSNFGSPASTQNREPRELPRLGEHIRTQSSRPRSTEDARAVLRNLLPLFHLLQSLRTPPPQHLLRTPEIKEFSKQYLQYMIEVKNHLIETKIYTEEEVITLEIEPLCAVYWLGLLRLIQHGDLTLDDSKKEMIAFHRKIGEQESVAALKNKPEYDWLTKELVAIKKLLSTLTEAQMQRLTKHLTYKEDKKDDLASTKKETEADAPVPAEVIAYRLITALKLKIDKRIVNPHEEGSPDKALPVAERIQWSRAFEPVTPADEPSPVA